MNLKSTARRTLAFLRARVRLHRQRDDGHACGRRRPGGGRSTSLCGTVAAVVVVAVLLSGLGEAQQAQRQTGPATAPAGGHEVHGTPEGWRFAWPKGNPARGREVFAKFECYSCHEVKGETFPAPSDPQSIGPELSSMAAAHEAEYFAESIINPNAFIEKGKGYQAADGSSKMPSFNDSMTIEEAIDLVAFLRSLTPPAGPAGHHRH